VSSGTKRRVETRKATYARASICGWLTASIEAKAVCGRICDEKTRLAALFISSNQNN
jgi:hypothetical protein